MAHHRTKWLSSVTAAVAVAASIFAGNAGASAAPVFPDTGSSSGAAPAKPTVPEVSTMDLLVYYTPEVLAARGSEQAVIDAINKGLQGMNDALARSEIIGRVRLAHAQQTDVSESVTGRDGAALDYLTHNAGAQRARTQHRADLVSLVVSGGGGIANQPNLPITSAESDSAWSVVGNDWLEPDLARGEAGVFAHELGHNLGAMHDWASSPESGGAHPERHGYVSPASHVDIMAYNTSALCTVTCQRKPYYSNPDVIVEGEAFGQRGGDHPSDIASVFSKSIPAVASYR